MRLNLYLILLVIKVVYSETSSYENLVLDETLKPGEYRPLTKEELEDLRSIAR